MRWENTKGTVELTVGSPSKHDSALASELLQNGLAHHQAGRLQEAEANYLSVLKEQPRHPDALHLLGVIAHQVGKHDIAVNLIENAIKIYPDHPNFYHNCGEAHRALHRHELAIGCYKQALAINPDYFDAHQNLGTSLMELGRCEEAIAHYKQAAAVKPDYAEAHNNLGVALHALGRNEGAIVSYAQAIAIKPDYAEAHYNLGLAHQKLDHVTDATACYQQAIAIKPDYADAHNNLGTALQGLCKLEEAVNHYKRAIAIRPDYADAHNNLGVALQALGQKDEAITHYERAIAIKPDYPDALNNLGNVLQQSGKTEQAFIFQRRAVTLDPLNDSYWAGFAGSLETLSFTTIDDNLWQDLWDVLGQSKISPMPIAQAVISALRHHPEFAEILRRINAEERGNPGYWDAAKQLSSIPLLLRIMELSSINDLEIEQMLTRLRQSMILNLKSRDCADDDKSLPFSVALALHCFTNEYLFQESSEETAAVVLLNEELATLVMSRQELPPILLAALAAYRPLYELSWIKELPGRDWPNVFGKVIARQVNEPANELSLRNQIPNLTSVCNAVSQAVRNQYEESPYPRWINAGLVPKARTIREILAGNELSDYVPPGDPHILVAGCGTGQHALAVASRFSNATILAIDLSLSSLSYALRKTREYGFTNIEYAQADIMELGDFDRQFDLIECGGVLHHLEDPLAGWRILLDLLRPGGLMKIGLYSELARRSVVRGREFIAKKGYTSAPEDIRRCRQNIVTLAEGGNSQMKKLIQFRDFFSMSECRDLLFHVKEHRFTLPQIETALQDFGLKFLWFELKDYRVISSFKTSYPEKTAPSSLSLWHQFETQNPDSFAGMYQFWVQKT